MRFWRWLAWLLPHELVKWAVVRVATYATSGKYSLDIIPEVTIMTALKRWDGQNER